MHRPTLHRAALMAYAGLQAVPPRPVALHVSDYDCDGESDQRCTLVATAYVKRSAFGMTRYRMFASDGGLRVPGFAVQEFERTRREDVSRRTAFRRRCR